MKFGEDSQLIYQLRQALDGSINELPPHVTQQLFKARQVALGRLSDTQPIPLISGNRLIFMVSQRIKLIMMVLALSTGLIGTYYWSLFENASEYEEIDSALLADEVPPTAYIDQGFHKWLARSSSSSSPQ